MKKRLTDAWDFACEVFWRSAPFVVGYAIGGYIGVKLIIFLKT